jgi:RecJ-like exonuclease
MSFATRLAPTTYEPVTGWTYREECPECEGRGGNSFTIRMAGEMFGGEQGWDTCTDCRGTGETGETLCQGCDAPVVDGKCDDCGVVFVDLPELDPKNAEKWQ